MGRGCACDEVDVKGLTWRREAARKERMRKVMDYRAELSARPPMQPSLHTTYVAERGEEEGRR